MTSGPYVPHQRIETFTVPQLVDLALRGKLRLPDVARPFVWSADQVRQLLDSVLRGFPIGALVLHERPAVAETVRLGPVEIAAPDTESAFAILDGHQRIATLVAALTPDDRGHSDTVFDLYATTTDQRVVHAAGGVVPAGALPLRESLSATSLLSWVRRRDEPDSSGDIEGLEWLVRAIREYTVPVHVLDTTVEASYDVFTRVNTSGVSLDGTQIFRSAFAGDDVNRNLAGVSSTLARHGFGALREDDLLLSLLAVRGGSPDRPLRNEFSPGEDRAAWLDATRAALDASIAFLVSQGVPHVRLMPTASVLPVLAAFFHLHPLPAPWNRRLLTRWLWRAWAHRAGLPRPVPLGRDVGAVLPRRLGHDDAPSEYEAARRLLATTSTVPHSVEGCDFRVGSAAGRLALLALAAVHPLGPDNTPIDVADMIELSGIDGLATLVENESGRFVRRADTAVEVLAYWPHGGPLPTRTASPAIRASHLLTDRSVEALRAGESGRFRLIRRASIVDTIDTLLSNRMEIGAPVRPPIADLVDPPESA